ncbi:hypothetical protein ACHRVW_16345 [Flavobacterium collinsii]|uniref:hypothetical protein n=1 Tax=Flavobacterium collinsii TaxID=1114861 RepID=UPI003756B64B
MRNVLLIFALISLKISAQISEAPGLGLPLDIPEDSYQELVHTYLNPNRNNGFSKNNYSFKSADFDLKKDKPVKQVSIDNNSDGINEYHLIFNANGRIERCENKLRNSTMIYQYLENLIVVVKSDRNSNYGNIASSIETDSIFFDGIGNIIKHSSTLEMDKKFGMGYRRMVVENQFSKENRLEKKYYRSINHLNTPLEEIGETVYENYRDSIVERYYSIMGDKLSVNHTSKQHFISRSVFYLDKDSRIFKTAEFRNDGSLDREVSIKYNDWGRITELVSSRGASGYFKYNDDGTIAAIREMLGQNEYFKYNCIYDSHSRFASAVDNGEDVKEFERIYTYDRYGNWDTLTFPNNGNVTTRTISYY